MRYAVVIHGLVPPIMHLIKGGKRQLWKYRQKKAQHGFQRTRAGHCLTYIYTFSMSGNVNHFPAGLHGLVSDLEFICEVAAGPKTPLREAITKEEEKHFVIWAMPKINVLLLRMVSLFPDDYKCQGSCRKHIPSRIQTFLLKAYLCRSYCPVWHGELIFP